MSNSISDEAINSIDVAIIGMAGRFPGAPNLDTFWQNICNGIESTTFFSDQELLASGISPALLNDPMYIKARPVLDNIDLFDADFFGFSPREAEIMDPQHRVFLECAAEVLENAGYDSEVYRGSIAVFAGTTMSTYLLFNLLANDGIRNSVETWQIGIGNEKDSLSTRVSYSLNLRGPSITVQSACSTSLVAVHLACQSLLNYQCDMALAGGVSIRIPQATGYAAEAHGIYSRDGHCRAFDANATGMILGNGVGVIILKRLAEALADGDYVHAVIKGSAVNNDGAAKMGYTAPGLDGQTEVISTALGVAGIDAETIDYVETHGSGTPLGDAIEVAALTRAFRATTSKTGFCAIGSVKTNVGHLDNAAGVAGLIKTVLALKHRTLPPSLNFNKPNPQIDFSTSPFFVNTGLSPWVSKAHPRRAGVSAFGIGGTNAHIILEEAVTVNRSSHSRPWQLLVLSARTINALEIITDRVADCLRHTGSALPDIAFTLQMGRKARTYRRVVVCREASEGADALINRPSSQVLTQECTVSQPAIAFMFSGIGDQYVGMGSQIYAVEQAFRNCVDYCSNHLKPLLGLDLREVLFRDGMETGRWAQQGIDLRRMLHRGDDKLDERIRPLYQTSIAHPALFIIEYALAQLWIQWGIVPKAMMGHSIGEYVAACLSGVVSLDDALTLVARRALLIESLPPGAMIAVPLAEEAVRPFLGSDLSLAAVNGPMLCVIAGTIPAVDDLMRQLTHIGLVCRKLPVSHAFHSSLMEASVGPFTELLSTIKLSPPHIPFVSTVTGTWITAQEATDPGYWARHLCQTVRFAEATQTLEAALKPILLEIGPGQTLCSLASQQLLQSNQSHGAILPSLPAVYDHQPEMAFLLSTLGRLWLNGVMVDWSGFYQRERRMRVPLPTYPFERQRYWIEPKQSRIDAPSVSQPDERRDITDWFYMPIWKQSAPPALHARRVEAPGPLRWLILCDGCGVGTALINRLRKEGQSVVTVYEGEEYRGTDDDVYTIYPHRRDDYDALCRELLALDLFPDVVVYLWSVGPCRQIPADVLATSRAQAADFFNLLFLAQAIGEHHISHPMHFNIVTTGIHLITGNETSNPEKATVLGLCKVIPYEYPNSTCRGIDIVLPESESAKHVLIDFLITECTSSCAWPTVSYRGCHRWEQDFDQIQLARQDGVGSPWRQGGVYLITGGLGGVGITLAQYLATTLQAKLVLIGRTELPPPEDWSEWRSRFADIDPISVRVRRVLDLEQRGAEVLIVRADVTDLSQMRAAMQQARDRFGDIHGVIHAAGGSQSGMIQLKTSGVAAQVLAPKVDGINTLVELFQDMDLDFMVLCSSINAIRGRLGQADHCAAGAYFDALAQHRASGQHETTSRWRLLSINWPPWLEIGQMATLPIPLGLDEQRDYILRDALYPEEGQDVFSRAVCSGLPQVVVSPREITLALAGNDNTTTSAVRSPADRRQGHMSTPSRSLYPRPKLATEYIAPATETERRVTAIWQALLGIEQVGTLDTFVELGGHSLLATQAITEISNTFGVHLSLSTFFGASTITNLARMIETLGQVDKDTLGTTQFSDREEGEL